MTSLNPSLLARALCALVAVAALATGPAARAADAPTAYRIVMANDVTTEALADMRKQAQRAVENCRDSLKMPKGALPPLPDVQLRKIVFNQVEAIYAGTSHARFTTARSVNADKASNCEPYVDVVRTADVVIDCEHQIVAMESPQAAGAMATDMLLFTHPRMKADPAIRQVDHGHFCTGKAHQELAGAPTTDAGQGTACVWLSQLLWAHMSPQGRQMMPQAAPAAGGLPHEKGDGCLLAERPYFDPPGGPVAPIIVKSFAHNRLDLENSNAYFAHNQHLVEIRKGAGIDSNRFSRGAVEQFMNLGVREALPAN